MSLESIPVHYMHNINKIHQSIWIRKIINKQKYKLLFKYDDTKIYFYLILFTDNSTELYKYEETYKYLIWSYGNEKVREKSIDYLLDQIYLDNALSDYDPKYYMIGDYTVNIKNQKNILEYNKKNIKSIYRDLYQECKKEYKIHIDRTKDINSTIYRKLERDNIRKPDDNIIPLIVLFITSYAFNALSKFTNDNIILWMLFFVISTSTFLLGLLLLYVENNITREYTNKLVNSNKNKQEHIQDIDRVLQFYGYKN